MPNDDSVVTSADLDWQEYHHGQRTFRRKRLGAAGGGEDLGTSLYELDPGKRTWPLHYHAANEEAIYVLDGSLRLWLGTGADERTVDIAVGDYVALPRGEAHAHEVEATGDEPARFLVVSTMNEPDLSIQPEADTVTLMTGSAPGDHEGRTMTRTLDFDATVDYWEE